MPENEQYTRSVELVKALCKEHCAPVSKTITTGGMTKFILDHCLFNPDHNNGSCAAIIVRDTGKIGYKCQHNGCIGRHWEDVRELWEPGYKERKYKWLKKPGRQGGDPLAKSKHIKNIVELAQANAEFYRVRTGEPFVTFQVDGHREHHPLDGQAFRVWLRMQVYHNLENINLTGDIWSQVLDILSADIDKNNREFLNLRVNGVAKDGRLEAIYIDVGLPDWSAIKVTCNGWEIVRDPPRLFYRRDTMLSLPPPAPAGEGDITLLKKYFRFKRPKLTGEAQMGLSEEDLSYNAECDRLENENNLLVMVFAAYMFIPHMPDYEAAYPVLCLIGEPGSSKTTTCKVLKRLIDPEETEALTMPGGDDRLVETLAHRHLPFFDNCRELTAYQSDRLCKTSYGEAMEKRRHYKNDESFAYKFARPAILNGVEPVITRPDLVDRAICLELGKIEQGIKTDTQFWTEYEKDRPRILSGILNVLVKAMKGRPEANPPKVFRMAEFTYWGYSIAEAIQPGEGETFIRAYERVRDDQNRLVSGADIVATAVKYLLDTHQGSWEGPATLLYQELDSVIKEDLHIKIKPDDYPRSPVALALRLRTTLKAVLESDGVRIEKDKKRDGRKIKLSLKPEPAPE